MADCVAVTFGVASKLELLSVTAVVIGVRVRPEFLAREAAPAVSGATTGFDGRLGGISGTRLLENSEGGAGLDDGDGKLSVLRAIESKAGSAPSGNFGGSDLGGLTSDGVSSAGRAGLPWAVAGTGAGGYGGSVVDLSSLRLA